jgi:RHS repeat-associated protein
MSGGASGYSYTGREWDASAQLYYSRARYYDAQLGRFISEDPIGLLGGFNLYQYAESSPVVYVDRFGLSPSGNWGPDNPNCPKILAQIQRMMSELGRMSVERKAPRFTLPPTMEQNHRDKWDEYRRRLKRKLRAYEKAGCGDPPPGAREACRRPYPEPEFEPVWPFPPMRNTGSNQNEQNNNNSQAAGGAAAAMIMIIIVILLLPVGA